MPRRFSQVVIWREVMAGAQAEQGLERRSWSAASAVPEDKLVEIDLLGRSEVP